MSVDALERMRVAFQSEALELLAELDTALLALEADPGNSDLVNRVFRAIHTVKGTGATAGFAHLARVAHKVEEAFDLARAGRLAISGELIDCGLKACDALRAILASEDAEAPCTGENEVFQSLAALLPASQAEPVTTAPAMRKSAGDARLAAFEIALRPHRDFFYSGGDPVTLLDELRGLGQAHIIAHTEAV